MKHAFVVAARASFPVRRPKGEGGCRLIDVAASVFYAWLRRRPTRRSQDEAILVAEIRRIAHGDPTPAATKRSDPSQ